MDQERAKALDEFNLDAFLPYKLVVVAMRLSRDFSTLYNQKFGITVPEWRVVAHLSQAGSVSVREIYKRVDMDKSKVSRAASRLEKLGFVAKTANIDDGRLISLSLTQKGKDMMAELGPIAAKFNAMILAEMGDNAGVFVQELDRLFNDKTEPNQA